MESKQIRNYDNWGLGETAIRDLLIEIAAQLAETNELIRVIAYTHYAPRTRKK